MRFWNHAKQVQVAFVTDSRMIYIWSSTLIHPVFHHSCKRVTGLSQIPPMYPTTQRLQWSESMLENCLPVEEKRVELTKFHLKKIVCFAICHAEENDYQTLCQPCQPGMSYKNVRSLTRSPICDSWKESKLSPSANQQINAPLIGGNLGLYC